MTDDRIEVQRTIPATAETIFAVLCDPRGHVEIDSSGMLQSATGDPVRASGDTFVVHMDRESLGDLPMGRYDVEVTIGEFEPARAISWTILGTLRPPVGHRYGYRLEPVDGGTLVTSYCDWSELNPVYRDRVTFPIISAGALKATLGILERTVARRGA